jgi:hypothetical protein
MSDPRCEKETRGGCRALALEYARRQWSVVPLHPNPDRTPTGAAAPVVEQLGVVPLVEIPEGATASPNRIREWEGIPETAPLGLLTGTDSNIVALEVPSAAATSLTARDLRRFRDALPDTLRVVGPDRTYHLFALPEETPVPPRLTRFRAPDDGLVLHGEDSLIRLPVPAARQGHGYRWDLTAPDDPAPFPERLRPFFGLASDAEALLWWRQQLAQDSAQEETDALTECSRVQPGSAPSAPEHRPGDSASPHGGLAFRSGGQLMARSDPESTIGVPWLATGALSVLCGASKTAGKSTFVLNLAAHLAAGRPFLDWSLDPQSVVLLSDLPPRTARTRLRRLDLGRGARERLHVLHPADAADLSWTALLDRTVEHADRVGAGLVVVDSLDQFVAVKDGPDPTASPMLAHRLTTEAPAACAVLAVKALGAPPPGSMRAVVDRLGLLGTAADLVLHLSAGPTQAHPTLRRLQFAGRLGPVPSYLLCEMVRGRYRRLRGPAGQPDTRAAEHRPALLGTEDDRGGAPKRSRLSVRDDARR